MPSALLAEPPPSPKGVKDAVVHLNYLADDMLYKAVKPKQMVPGFADDARTNVKLTAGDEETIQDVRRLASHNGQLPFSLDTNGFKYVKSATQFRHWTSQDRISTEYLAEIETLLKTHVSDVDEIIFFDARFRHAATVGTRQKDGLNSNPFARQVHVDQTESSIITKIRALTDLKADYLLRGRCRIINVWRPVGNPVYDCALAIADGANLQPGDVIECDRHRRDTGQFFDTMGVVRYRPGYDWYYMSEQTQDDVLIFKNYDSDTSCPARHCLHTAFDVPFCPPDAPRRKSIEVRALIFTYPTMSALAAPPAVQHPVLSERDLLATLSPVAHSLRAPPLENSDLLPETFRPPPGPISITHVALLETEIARLTALLFAQTRQVATLQEQVLNERTLRLRAQLQMQALHEDNTKKRGPGTPRTPTSTPNAPRSGTTTAGGQGEVKTSVMLDTLPDWEGL